MTLNPQRTRTLVKRRTTFRHRSRARRWLGTFGRSRSASLVPSERTLPSMKDNDKFEKVPSGSALNALPPNGARVARSLGLAGAARGCRPLVIFDTLRVSQIARGAAQLAPRERSL